MAVIRTFLFVEEGTGMAVNVCPAVLRLDPVPAAADRRRDSGSGRGTARDPIPHDPAVRAGRRQPDRVFANRRGQLHAPLRLRLLVPARVAGPIAESLGRRSKAGSEGCSTLKLNVAVRDAAKVERVEKLGWAASS